MDATHTLEPTAVSHAEPLPARRRTDAGNHLSDQQDDLLSASSVLISVVIGAGLWAVLIMAGWLIFR